MSSNMSNKLCRACLRAKESFTYFLIDNVPSEIYWYCTSIEVKQEEKLPRALCNMCYNLLSKFFDFKQTCIQSQKTLLSYNSAEPEDKDNHGFLFDSDTKIERYCNDIVDAENSNYSDDHFETKLDNSGALPVKEEQISNNFHNVQLELEVVPKTIVDTKKIHKRRKRKIKTDIIKKAEKLSGSIKRSIICSLCEKRFYSASSYNVHKLMHNSKDISIQCSACSKTFMSRSGLRRHLQSSHTKINLEKLKCKTCGKIFKSKETLKMHFKTHGERKFFVCDVCGKSCTTAYSLKAHLETHKENRERRFTCEHCGKKFFTNNMLISHVSRRHTARRYICDICNFPFTDKSNLAKHLLLHDGKKPHKCDICHKTYRARSSLVEHKRIHSGERPYACSYCPKCFLSKKRLTDHHRIHTGEKPYKCDVCELAFTQCGTLNRHMKVHDRNVPVLA